MNVTEDLSVETQKALATAHVQHFRAQLERAPRDRTVNASETRTYLEIWTEGLEALDKGEKLSEACINEMTDAVWSGDYDKLLKPDELEKLETWLNEDEAG